MTYTVPFDIGEYTFTEQLSGNGRVFAGHHKTDRLDVILKVCGSESIRSSDSGRIVAEEAHLKSLTNVRGVPTFIECDVGEFGPYLIMQRAGTTTLDDWVRERQPNLHSVVVVLLKVGRILEQIHGHGLVHCDVKPTNVVMDGDEPSVVDFDVSRRIGEIAPPMEGTAVYMAPERILGHDTSEQIDIFSFGVMLRELTQMVSRKRVPTDLMTVIEKCECRQADLRFASFGEVNPLLASWLRSRLMRRWVAASVAGVMILGAAGWQLWSRSSEQQLSPVHVDLTETATATSLRMADGTVLIGFTERGKVVCWRQPVIAKPDHVPLEDLSITPLYYCKTRLVETENDLWRRDSVGLWLPIPHQYRLPTPSLTSTGSDNVTLARPLRDGVYCVHTGDLTRTPAGFSAVLCVNGVGKPALMPLKSIKVDSGFAQIQITVTNDGAGEFCYGLLVLMLLQVEEALPERFVARINIPLKYINPRDEHVENINWDLTDVMSGNYVIVAKLVTTLDPSPLAAIRSDSFLINGRTSG